MTASDLAEWWDDQHRQYKDILGKFVEENPNVVAVGLATLGTVPTELGGGLVDTLRFGKGLAEGGVAGVGMDALRLLGLLGPAGKVSRYIANFGVTKLALYIKDPAPTVGICTWVATAKALAQSGAGQLFATVEEIASKAGMGLVPPSGLPSIWADELIPAIRQLGGKVRNLGIPSSMRQVMLEAQDHLRPNSAMLVAIKWTLRRTGQAAEHTIYLFKDSFGRIRMSDRTGVVCKTLADFEKAVPFWEGIANAEVFSSGSNGAMLLLEGPQMLYLNVAQTVSALMMPLIRLVAINENEVSTPDEVKARFELFKQQQMSPPAPTQPAPTGGQNLPPVEWLTGVQERLRRLGFYTGPVNDKFDQTTKQAVIAFQTKYSSALRVDGIPGPKTQAKLREVYGA